MTNEEAIKYLKQLYPNGGHCWLDEQRIEAIGMAIKALQEEPVSEDLEEAVNAYIGYAPEVDESSSTYGKRQAFKAGANWQKHQDKSKVLTEEQCRKIRDDAFELGKDAIKQQMMKEAVNAECFGFQDAALFSFRLPSDKYLVGSEVKVIVIKEY